MNWQPFMNKVYFLKKGNSDFIPLNAEGLEPIVLPWTDCINGGQKYYIVFVLIRPTSLHSTDKIQKKCSFRTRLVGLICTLTKE